MIARHNPFKSRHTQPRGKFLPGSRQNADWKLRWQELFAGKDRPQGKVTL